MLMIYNRSTCALLSLVADDISTLIQLQSSHIFSEKQFCQGEGLS